MAITLATKCTLVSSVSPEVGTVCSWGRGWARTALSTPWICILPNAQPCESAASLRGTSLSSSSPAPPVSSSPLPSSVPSCCYRQSSYLFCWWHCFSKHISLLLYFHHTQLLKGIPFIIYYKKTRILRESERERERDFPEKLSGSRFHQCSESLDFIKTP